MLRYDGKIYNIIIRSFTTIKDNLVEVKNKLKINVDNMDFILNCGNALNYKILGDTTIDVIPKNSLVGGMDNKSEKKPEPKNKKIIVKYFEERHDDNPDHVDRFNQLNRAVVRNQILSNPLYSDVLFENEIVEAGLRQINIIEGEFNEEHRLADFTNLRRFVFRVGRFFYYTNASKLLRLGYNTLNHISSYIANCMEKLGEGYLKIYPTREQFTWVLDDCKFSRKVSYGTRISKAVEFNKIKVGEEIIKMPCFSSLPMYLASGVSSNNHDKLGYLRAAEELYVKDEMKNTFHGSLFIGIGENLRRFDDFPGIYINQSISAYDEIRISKYKSMSLKNPVMLNNALFIGDEPVAERTIFHSTDVFYYISNQVFNFMCRDDIHESVHYHTFNIYKKGDYKLHYNYEDLKREDDVVYSQPNGNEEPYIHKNVVFAGQELTPEYIKGLFVQRKMEYPLLQGQNIGLDIAIIHAFQINEYQDYITVRISQNDKNKNVFTTRDSCYCNKMYLYDESPRSVNDLGALKIVPLEKTNIQNYIFDNFAKWIDGNNAKMPDEFYSIRNTFEYNKGFYFMNDEIIFLRQFKNLNNKEYLSDELNADVLRFAKYNVDFKISISKFNEILMMYRGISIKNNMIKNAVVSIINKAKEDWHMEIDIDYAYILAVFAARYMAKINQGINKEMALNKDIYSDALYQEKKGWIEQIKDIMEKNVFQNNELIENCRRVVNSTNVDNIKSFNKRPYNERPHLRTIWRHIQIFVYYWYCFYKNLLIGASSEQLIFMDSYYLIKEQLYRERDYNVFGQSIDMVQRFINSDTVMKQSVLGLLTNVCVQYGKHLFVRKPKKILQILFALFNLSIILVILFLFIIFIRDVNNISIIFDLFKCMIGIDINMASYIIINIVCIMVVFYVNGLEPLIRFRINLILYPILYLINNKLLVLISFIRLFTNGRLSYRTIMLLVILRLVQGIQCYTNVEYVNKIVYNPGSCTMNDFMEMYAILKTMKCNFEQYKQEYKLTERIANKFKILDIKEPKNKHPGFEPNREPLVQKGFKLNGYFCESNEPLKLHSCFWCETEAVYRQVQSKIDYDDAVLEDFKNFIQPKIKQLIEENEYGESPELTSYLMKLGSKRYEFEQGYDQYLNGQRLILPFKMHTKTDEKIFMNYGKFKMKARNISAQHKQVKLILGVVCETMMSILHRQDWSGPGKNNIEKCRIFSKYMDKVMYNQAVLCADGSAFDSTQHRAIQEIVDIYAFNLILKGHPELLYIASYQDLKAMCEQEEYHVYSKFYHYKIQGTQMTGRMNTCLGNTLRSWAYIEFIKYNMKKAYPWINLDRIQFMVNGDDQIIFMPKTYMEKYERVAYEYVYAKDDLSMKHGLGQIAKIFEKHEEINGAEFLSCILLHDPAENKFMLVRKFDRFLQLTPFTYSNNYLDIRRFRMLNAQLLIADAQNILSTKTFKCFRKYAEKMLEIGEAEMKYLIMNFPYKQRDFYRIRKQINKVNFIMQFKDHYKNENDTKIFEEQYEKFMEKQYGITQDDWNEYYKVLDSINHTNYLESDFKVHLVDKMFNLKDHSKYDQTVKEINKTKVQTEIKLCGYRMDVKVYEPQ